MLKIKNNFITFIIIGVFLIIGLGIFNSIFLDELEKHTFIVLVEGEGMKNNKMLNIDKKVLLDIGDTVKTIGNNALAVIEWGDGSVTRLGGNSVVKIEELNMSKDIQISFKLLEGKSWSNVISFLGSDSYFKETFIVNNIDTVASVRGTIFDLDLVNNYLNVIDHNVNVSDTTGKNIIVNKFNPLSLINFDIIRYEDFIINFRDNTWNKLNKTFDIRLINNLKKELANNLASFKNIDNFDIDDLSESSKKELYNNLLEKYQKINFIDSTDDELFKIKLNLKKQLIKLADKNNKIELLKNTLYDFKDTVINNTNDLDNIIGILNENKDILNNIDINNYFDKREVTIDLQNILNTKLKSLNNIFKKSGEFKNIIDTNLDNIGSGLNNIKGTLDKGVQNELNKTFGKYIN